MKLEDQVISLESAQKLKELGIKQESIFCFRAYENPSMGFISEDKVTNECWILYHYDDKFSKSCDWEISAFTAQELLDELNAFIRIGIEPDSKLINVYYQPETGTDNSYTFEGTNLADLLAQVKIAQIKEDEIGAIQN